jgi:hypothetical protein
MKKKMLILMAGLLLMGVNVFAAGDLIVNGKIGVGTSGPLEKLHVYSNSDSKALRLELLASDAAWTNIGAFYDIGAVGAGVNDRAYIGFQGQAGLTGFGNIDSLIGAENIVYLGTNTSSNVSLGKGNTVILRRTSTNSANHTLTNYFGFHSYGNTAGSGSISGTNWRHAYFENFPDYGGNRSAVTGLWIDKQTRGTNNYGIVLNGDGNGADIVFGPTQSARIYSNTGRLYAQDSFGNQTILSPHDPETGEWVYYSKNVKTGKVVRVNMEQLVKAVEKLTGENFLIETQEGMK